MSKLFLGFTSKSSTYKYHKKQTYALKLSLSLFALLITLISVWPVSAAVELNYFSVVPSSSAILLEWGTAKEYNIIGFQLMCKQVGEADSAYHPIVTKSNKGSPSEGSTYDHLVTSGLKPGIPYCFRLQEITTNGDPGQIFDRCGYGLNITPTPTLEPQFLAETATAQVFANATAAILALTPPTPDPANLTSTPQTPLVPEGTPNLIETQQAIFAQQTAQAVAAAVVLQQMADATGTAIALGGPATETAVALTLTPIAPATPDPNQPGVENGAQQQPVSPLPTDPTATPDPNAAGPAPEVALQQTQEAESIIAMQTAQASQTEEAVRVQQAQIDQAAQAAQTQVAMQTEQAVQSIQAAQANQQAPVDPVLQATQTAQAIELAQTQPVPQSPDSPLALENGTTGASVPGYPYVVVTAAPPTAPPTIVPTLTALPTAIPASMPLLASLIEPTPQNIMIGMLFIVFVGASGIGILGLLSSVFYARSHSRRRDRYDY